jgi:hypothetical protein
MFARSGRLRLDGFSVSGADWLERYKPKLRCEATATVGILSHHNGDRNRCFLGGTGYGQTTGNNNVYLGTH